MFWGFGVGIALLCRWGAVFRFSKSRWAVGGFGWFYVGLCFGGFGGVFGFVCGWFGWLFLRVLGLSL